MTNGSAAPELLTGRPLAGKPGDKHHQPYDCGGDPDGYDGVPVERAEHWCYRKAMLDGRQTAQVLREQAARCRRMARGILDTEVARRLLELAVEFDDRAVAEEVRSPLPS